MTIKMNKKTVLTLRISNERLQELQIELSTIYGDHPIEELLRMLADDIFSDSIPDFKGVEKVEIGETTVDIGKKDD